VADARAADGRDDTVPMETKSGPRPWVAFLADLAVVAVFVLIGRRTHHEDAGFVGFLRVCWPFAVALVVGWAVTRLDRAPLAWGRVVGTWLVTVVLGMALRIAVQGHEFKGAFTVVATLFLGAGLLGWRAAVRAVTRRRSAASPD
jgi:hypothetical protein